jgi:hypothetical protein
MELDGGYLIQIFVCQTHILEIQALREPSRGLRQISAVSVSVLFGKMSFLIADDNGVNPDAPKDSDWNQPQKF